MPNYVKLTPREAIAMEECKDIVNAFKRLQNDYLKQEREVHEAFIAIENGKNNYSSSKLRDAGVKFIDTFDRKTERKLRRLSDWEDEKKKLDSIMGQIHGCVLLLGIITSITTIT